jgi:hypothetical protein
MGLYMESADFYDYRQHECAYEIQLKNASDFLEGILEHLYGNKPLDKNNLDHCIEEICVILGNKFPKNDLTIKRIND